MIHSAFEQVIGHGPVIDYFFRLIAQEQYAHAYLLSGPSHIGKSMMAERFLAEVLKTPVEQLDFHGNFLLLDGEASIKVDQIRALQEHFAHSGFHGQKKAALIIDAHRMTVAAQNALLKTLEEPSGESVLILTSSQPEQLLATIRSRCQQMHLSTVPREALCEALQETLPEEQAHLLANLSGGRPGLAMQLQDPEKREHYLALRDRAFALLRTSSAEQFMGLSQLAKDDHRDAIMQQLLFLLHDLAAISQGNLAQIMNADLQDDMVQLAQNRELSNWSSALRAWLHAREAMDRNASPALALESLALSLSSL